MLLGHTSLRAFARVVPNTWTLFPQHLPGLRPCLRRYPLAPGVATLAPLPVPALLFSAVLTTGPRGCCFLVCPSPGQLCQCRCVACVWMHLQRCSWAGGGRRKWCGGGAGKQAVLPSSALQLGWSWEDGGGGVGGGGQTALPVSPLGLSIGRACVAIPVPCSTPPNSPPQFCILLPGAPGPCCLGAFSVVLPFVEVL